MESAGSTSIIVIGMAAAAVELLIGMTIGWWLRGGKQSASSDAKTNSQDSEEKLQNAENALSNLRELAQRVQADVGAHSSQVEAISNQLNAQQSDGKPPGPGRVGCRL